ncbi:hypothetical protein [Rhodococcoides corynebacterioides]|uniref:DUF2178 domain-containing protein n=1 Tax=Rhodococcoides corynebacterioides TaxID=53972 RepID=A0ABS7NZB7_9NOCA|nr:hypothetical protein [Rhodococcus corynebacterioides]MBY6365476.1 hypothetical protein [Rhodococcus corynebacterioides]MBY6409449.1 hypothetical protein [Rhodococcus corynebacterioides]
MDTSKGRWSRRALWLSVALLIATAVWAVATTDGPVALRVDASGEVTRVGSVWTLVGVLGGIGGVLAATFLGAQRFLPHLPARLINLPSAEAHAFWTAPENRNELHRLLAEDLEWIGAATLVLFSWLTAVCVTAENSVAAWALVVPVVAYTIAVLGYSVHLMRGGRYRPRS